ncbi:CaiB/BaiF CoA-transferase family protein [Solwaraspora sp. WMMD1047]|uniref:CaiB/BaiF CoA transferase family protein n=1 Tax=Solwaraspora sp. WMMD1047 TaxID=3016102 RepID=UPI002416B20B|nr:CaiB/BaiF CoA-transferase family protein [Solwaraspora sp. WMMD1047]MDG4834376.1 CaiB/BaiF CoA-transferase family protein [Solwaraspora sp. WMMD1047]
MTTGGPLAGVRVLELAALGPVPFTGMLLADLGAEVIRVDRAGADAPGVGADPGSDPRHRGRRSIGLDLKRPTGVAVLLRLVGHADVLMEGMRPGVAERLGIGPEECLHRNPRLVYGRMTGWGQDGPLAHRAGHDLNYLSLTGALHAMGPAEAPPPVPLNLIGDFGGGATYLALGIVCALLERVGSGRGQVVDAAMLDGAASLTALFHGLIANGTWSAARADNVLDGGAPYYRTYATGDGGFLAVGAIEPKFYATLLRRLGLAPADWPQHDRSRWAEQSARLAAIFATRTRAEWERVFDGSDACVTPVLTFAEAPAHPHLAARRTLVDVDGLVQPAPAPRFSRSTPTPPGPPVPRRAHTDQVLAELGVTAEEIARWRHDRVIA